MWGDCRGRTRSWPALLSGCANRTSSWRSSDNRPRTRRGLKPVDAQSWQLPWSASLRAVGLSTRNPGVMPVQVVTRLWLDQPVLQTRRESIKCDHLRVLFVCCWQNMTIAVVRGVKQGLIKHQQPRDPTKTKTNKIIIRNKSKCCFLTNPVLFHHAHRSARP